MTGEAASYVLAPAPARPARLIVEPDDGRAPFLDAINSARTSITQKRGPPDEDCQLDPRVDQYDG